MNGNGYEHNSISAEELQGLQGTLDLDLIPTFSEREKLAILYTRMITQTPVSVSDAFISQVKATFNEREIIVIVTTAAQVNYWARLIRALGIPSAEFMDHELMGGK
jgi:alkylhydroperoxidase family enzyme